MGSSCIITYFLAVLLLFLLVVLKLNIVKNRVKAKWFLKNLILFGFLLTAEQNIIVVPLAVAWKIRKKQQKKMLSSVVLSHVKDATKQKITPLVSLNTNGVIRTTAYLCS